LYVWVNVAGYSEETASLVMLMALALFPYTMSLILDSTFQAWERMHFIAYANAPVGIAKVIIASVLLAQGYGVRAIILMMLGVYAVVAILKVFFILRFISRPALRISPASMWRLFRSSMTFFGIEATLAIRSNLSVLLLASLATETEVGLFNAANQFLVPLIVIYESVGLSVFPVMCRRFVRGVKALKQISEHAMELLLTVGLPLVIGVFFMADWALVFLYKDEEFGEGAGALRVIVWVAAMRAAIQILGRALRASHNERAALKITVVTTTVWFTSGILLTAQFGIIGTAWSVTLTGVVNLIVHYRMVVRLLFQPAVVRVTWKPVLSAAVMGLYLALVHQQAPWWFTIATAGALYVIVWGGLTVWTLGGSMQRFRARYLELWSE
jgi:O-antigen/teichoic acid export membrane protein